MKQELFEQKNQMHWFSFTDMLDALEAKRKKDKKNLQSADFPAKYRLICHHLSIAKTRGYSPQLIQYLNELMKRGHRQLYQYRSLFLYRFLEFITTGFPQSIRQNWTYIWIASAIFYLPAILLFLLVMAFPDLIYNVFDPHDVARFESMYDPTSDRIGRDRQSDTDVMMFGHYIANNIGVAFRTFATGLLFTLGSLFFLLYNGIIFGALASHLTMLGSGETFYTFVVGHCAFELTAITFSGAAGIKLGFSVIAPGLRTRVQALKESAKECVSIMYGVILMLLMAAFVEAFWSSNTSLTPMIKYGVGATLWALVILYFCFAGRANESRSVL
jgi:uncharacterized membrane protein SpoIIM required for sporulation